MLATLLKKTIPALAALVICATAAQAASQNPTIASKLEIMGKPNESLQVTDLRVAKENALMRIQAEVTNSATSNQQLYYRFKWLDRDGFTVWDEEPWKPLTIYAQQKQIIQVVSPTFKARDFHLELQSPGGVAN